MGDAEVLPQEDALTPRIPLREAVNDTKVAPLVVLPLALAQGEALPLPALEEDARGEPLGEGDAAAEREGGTGVPEVEADRLPPAPSLGETNVLGVAAVEPEFDAESGAVGVPFPLAVAAPLLEGAPVGEALIEAEADGRALTLARALRWALPVEETECKAQAEAGAETVTGEEGLARALTEPLPVAAGEALPEVLIPAVALDACVAEGGAVIESVATAEALSAGEALVERVAIEGVGGVVAVGDADAGKVVLTAAVAVVMPAKEPVAPNVKKVGRTVRESVGDLEKLGEGEADREADGDAPAEAVRGALSVAGGVAAAESVAAVEPQPLAVALAVVLPLREGETEGRPLPVPHHVALATLLTLPDELGMAVVE